MHYKTLVKNGGQDDDSVLRLSYKKNFQIHFNMGIWRKKTISNTTILNKEENICRRNIKKC